MVLYARIAVAVALIAGLEGCAASRALDQPHEKNLNVLKPGTERDMVRAEFGVPLPSSAGANCDVYAFEEGSTGWRYLRALSYSVLDVGTLGISEIVTNPVESSVGKAKIQLRVCFNDTQQLVYTEKLQVGAPAKLLTGTYPPPSLVPAAPPPQLVETAPLPPVASEPAPSTSTVAASAPPAPAAPAPEARSAALAVAPPEKPAAAGSSSQP